MESTANSRQPPRLLPEPSYDDIYDAQRVVRFRRKDIRAKLVRLTSFVEAVGLVPELSPTPDAVVTLNGRTYR